MGFCTQAPSPALRKAVNSRALAVWYSLATSLASWYTPGLRILERCRWMGICRDKDKGRLAAPQNGAKTIGSGGLGTMHGGVGSG